jgi:hypothetical protein
MPALPPPPLRPTSCQDDEWEMEGILNHYGPTMKDLEYQAYFEGCEPVMDLEGRANDLLKECHEAHGAPGLQVDGVTVKAVFYLFI